MNNLRQIACLLACVAWACACQSTDKAASDAAEVAKGGMDTTLFLSQLREIHAIANAPTKDTIARSERALAKIREFNKTYPAWEPISRDSMEKTILKSPPKGAGIAERAGYLGQQVYTRPAVNKYKVPFEYHTGFEELIPHVYFPVDKKALIHAAYYRDTFGDPVAVMVIDRGYLGGFAARAHWFYLQNGFIGADKSMFYFGEEGNPIAAFDGMYYWAGWHYDMNKSYRSKAKGIWVGDNRLTLQTYWKGRWQIVLERSDNLGDLRIVDTTWAKTVR
ncbi:hypothetical protein [Spirosoma arcticum]